MSGHWESPGFSRREAVKEDVVSLDCYLDNAATTPVAPEVARAMLEAMGVASEHRLIGSFANPSAAYRWGVQASRCVDAARGVVATTLGGQADEVVFTSGGTEANNLAILGLASALRRRGRHLITTEVEHRSVLDACHALEEEGWEVTRLPVDDAGQVQASQVQRALRPDTVLCTLAHVNNEVGTIQPIAEIAQALGTRGPILHVDGVQACGKMPTPYALWGVGLASLSAHKINGPKGVGALWIRAGVRVRPLFHGGGQQGGLRPGTENVPGIVGFRRALELATADATETTRRLREHKLRLWRRLREALPGLAANGPDPEDPVRAAPHILNVCFERCLSGVVRAEVLLHRMEEHGLACSAGSACSARRPAPSHVLVALRLGQGCIGSSLRFSVGLQTATAEIDRAVDIIRTVVSEHAEVAARWSR